MVAAGSRLLWLPFVHKLPAVLLSTLADVALGLLVVASAWQASRRSIYFARIVWISVAIASALWALSDIVGAVALAFAGFGAALEVFWQSTIIFYVVGIVLAVPLLQREDEEESGIDWLRTFDVAQLGILTFCAYLIFFYVPATTNSSEASRIHSFIALHLLRDGFLALGFLYRGWRSRAPALRRLQIGLAIFFVGYIASGSSIYFYVKASPWQIPLLDLLADIPLLFLLWLAVSWHMPAETAPPPQVTRSPQELFWAQSVPVVLPISVIALASRASAQYMRIAWTAVAASVMCYAGRLMVMHRREAEVQSRLRAVEERLAQAFRSSPAAITISRLSDGRYIDVNDRWLELMKLARQEVIGRTSTELGIWTHPTDRKRLTDALGAKGSVRDTAFDLQMAGRTVPALVSAELTEFDGEQAIIASVLDVSELAHATQQLRQAQKMEAVGRLAGGVAHDFNNLLTIISGYSELQLETTEAGDEVHRQAKEIRAAARRAASLTQQLLAFSRQQVLQPKILDLNEIIREMERMFARLIGEDVETRTVLAPDLGLIEADPGQIEQILMNLVVNSRDAMPHGGKLTIDTANSHLGPEYTVDHSYVMPGDYVRLAVTDTGIGMDAETCNRIFEPFYTTKEMGKGTGLGLSTVHGIVKQSGGHIEVYSELGHGTTFKIYLPRAKKASIRPRLEPQRSVGQRGSEKILLAEDDAQLRELAASVLVSNGYTVFPAADADEVDAICAQQSVDLLVTDVVMPKMSGKDIATRVSAHFPRAKTLYMSGYTTDAMVHHGVLNEGIFFLQKPFTPAALAAKVREVLDSDQ